MHSELRRQLSILGLSEETPPDADGWRAFLSLLRQVQEVRDEERKRLTRSQPTPRMVEDREHQEANFKMLVERSPNPIFVSDAASSILYANENMAKLLGHSNPSEVVGVLLNSVVHPDDLDIVHQARKRWAAGEDASIEVRWFRKDGAIIVVSGATTPITFDGISAGLTTLTDITEQKKIANERDQATAALRLSEERYRVLFDSAPIIVVVFDPATLRVLEVNDAATILYGYSREEFLKLGMLDLKVDQADAELKGAQSEVLSGAPQRPYVWRGIKEHRKKNGEIVQLDLSSHGVTIEGRRAVLSMAYDVTDKRRLEEQLRHSQKMEAVGRLAGGVAHDFNNILAVILADTDYVKEELGAENPVWPQLDEIGAAAERAAALTHQLLAFSRRQILKPRVLALNAVVTDMERMLRRLIGEDMVLEMKLEPTLGAVMADPGQLEQVIMNLIVNARDAMTHGGRITMQTHNMEVLAGDRERPVDLAPGPYVALTVTDTGSGMDDATIARIFEPFFTTKGVGRGTGLGLSTVFGIVQQSGGFIHVTSRVGVGSSFRISLPRVDQHIASSTKKIPSATAAIGDERVLLVEDDPHVRRAAKRALQRRGYSVIEAANGEEAIARYRGREEEFDLVVTDIVMPGLDGVEVAARLREEDARVRILYMSGYSEHTALRDGETCAGDPFLQKPFSADELASAVRGALDS
jgi:PAS domain S-box-containing protein